MGWQSKTFSSLVELRMNDLRILVPVINIDPHLRMYFSRESD